MFAAARNFFLAFLTGGSVAVEDSGALPRQAYTDWTPPPEPKQSSRCLRGPDICMCPICNPPN